METLAASNAVSVDSEGSESVAVPINVEWTSVGGIMSLAENVQGVVISPDGKTIAFNPAETPITYQLTLTLTTQGYIYQNPAALVRYPGDWTNVPPEPDNALVVSFPNDIQSDQMSHFGFVLYVEDPAGVKLQHDPTIVNNPFGTIDMAPVG